MTKLITKTLFILVFFLSLLFQPSFTQIHVPRLRPQRAADIQDTSKKLQGKQEASDEMLQFKSGGHLLGFRKGDVFIASGDHALRIEFVDSRPVSPVTDEIALDTVKDSKYETPLGRIIYKDLWDGVTLVYKKHSSGVVKSTYKVQPSCVGSSGPVDRIRLRYNVPVGVDGAGDLIFSFETGKMRESRPVAWQEIEGKRIPVEVSFRSLGKYEVGFRLGPYDPLTPLVIDPIMNWNTFLGSTDIDDLFGITLDTSGNIYVAGSSKATWGSPVNPYPGGLIDAFVAKLDSGGVLQWNTFMGSSGAAVGMSGCAGITVHSNGNIYVVGTSTEAWGMPINPFSGTHDAFVAKLNKNGVLLWHTFMGSAEGTDSGHAIALDSSENVYVIGTSYKSWGTPINAHAGYNDAFVAKLNSNGARQWNTFMGSQASLEGGSGIALDTDGNVYVTGYSCDTWGTPINPYAGGWYEDAFVAKLNNSGILQWNTFMGTLAIDYGDALALDKTGNIYFVGSWELIDGKFGPVEGDAFVAKLDSGGVLQWNTIMAGAGVDYCKGISIDTSGNIYVAGSSKATWGVPIHSHSGSYDAFIAKLNSSGALRWNTFMGSLYSDRGYAIDMDTSHNIYAAGDSSATWGSPINSHSGSSDGFVAKIIEPCVYIFDGHDFNGNGSTDASVFRPSNGKWYLKGIGSYFWGGAGDIPVNGDYNGDGTTDVAVWRPSNGKWYLRGIGEASWGGPSDIPVPGNYNGDINGTTDIAVWRPSNGRWYIKGVGGLVWGTAGDIPVPGDYNGDGKTDIAVWRPSNGKWYIKGVIGLIWGGAADIPVPADYNGDGKTDIAVWRPSNGRWYIKGVAGSIWGAAGDVPVPGDYNGDGKTDIAVWRPSNGKWYIKGIGGYIWGVLGDIPLVR